MEHDGEIVEFTLGTQLEDVNILHQPIVPRTNYAQVLTRLNYIFMYSNLLGTVIKAGYLEIHEGIVSDHRM